MIEHQTCTTAFCDVVVHSWLNDTRTVLAFTKGMTDRLTYSIDDCND